MNIIPTVIPTITKKEVRFEGDFQDTLPRSRSNSGKTSASRSSGRRRKGNRTQKKLSSSSHDNTQQQHSRHSHRRRSRHLPLAEEPSTSTQARMRADMIDSRDNDDDDDDETETTRSVCSTCSSSSSDSDDFVYELPQRQVYGGVRVNYVPNDAIAIARKEQQMKNDQSHGDRDKNCTIS